MQRFLGEKFSDVGLSPGGEGGEGGGFGGLGRG